VEFTDFGPHPNGCQHGLFVAELQCH